ncbi:MAG: type II toxin-antitoxin system RelE/ParE family toxin [Candidatus Micrarchaeota archaeon]|nr:type II toxin-antitoxin system RelE/ParE family toxin [Candidatus Micrarchaeota archaeon]
MAFSIAYSEESVAILERFDPAVAKRIVSKLQQAAKDPMHYFKRLKDSELYKLRVGDYRVMARLDFAQETLFIATIGHRRNIYD